ncbi:MAG: hypothetical protein QOE47_2781, partial [Pyrinomonadaceae bacterium]|nr:hypothetical protein [Pyrinomonadaceae bacterium]
MIERHGENFNAETQGKAAWGG